MMELSLDNTGIYTKYIIISRNNYINPDLIIDDTINNNGHIDVYELLNFEGIKNIFQYQDLYNNIALSITDNDINYTINTMKYDSFNDNNLKEIMIEIKHRVKKK